MSNKNRRRGKDLERYVDSLFPTARRVGILGKEDIQLKRFSMECKERKAIAIRAWMEQAEKYADGKIPVIWIHQHNTQHRSDMVVFLASFAEKIIKEIEDERD